MRMSDWSSDVCSSDLKPDSLSLALSTADCTCLALPISASIFSTASLAPPCAGPHSAATPVAMHAYGLAPVEPTRRTVDVDAFCSWSACRMTSRSSAVAATGLQHRGEHV